MQKRYITMSCVILTFYLVLMLYFVEIVQMIGNFINWRGSITTPRILVMHWCCTMQNWKKKVKHIMHLAPITLNWIVKSVNEHWTFGSKVALKIWWWQTHKICLYYTPQPYKYHLTNVTRYVSYVCNEVRKMKSNSPHWLENWRFALLFHICFIISLVYI